MKHVFTFLLAISATTMYAQPGTIDKTYGTDKTGTVNIPQLYTQAAAIYPGDKTLAGGYSSTLVTPSERGFLLTRRLKDGSPDTAFGTGGQVTTKVDDIVPNVRQSLGWTGIAVQPDGKIVAAGGVGWSNPNYPEGYFVSFDIDIVLARFLPDGTPDESFGNKGRVVTNLGFLENITAVAVQPDGKIVVSGYQSTEYEGAEGNDDDILVVRYNMDGSLDESFGEGGYVLDTYGFDFTYGYALLLQPDGKIVVGGSYAHGNFYLIRYQTDGTIDESFGINGSVKTSFPSQNGYTLITGLALDDKGRIVAAGYIGTFYTVISRYMPDGSLDNSFDEDGKLVLDYNSYPVVYSEGCQVLAQPGNKLVVVSQVSDDEFFTSFVIALSGLNEDGSKDASFGTDKGQTITTLNLYDAATNIKAAQQSDGKIIVSGNNPNSGVLARFNGYPVHVSLAVRIKRFLQNHGITWKGLPADDKIAYYSVEQSSSRAGSFASLTKVSGRSNLNDYSFTNNHLLTGANYYRVKAVSIDGTVRYSEVVSADNTAASASVYPNPARSYVTVQGLPADATANITLKDGSGTVLQRGVSGGSAQYRSSLANLLPGTYYLNITTTNGKTEVLPFVKE